MNMWDDYWCMNGVLAHYLKISVLYERAVSHQQYNILGQNRKIYLEPGILSSWAEMKKDDSILWT